MCAENEGVLAFPITAESLSRYGSDGAASGLPDSYETILTEAPFWHYLLNLGVIANSVEEILEFVSAVCLLMTMASLFSVGFLGFRDAEDGSVG